MAGVLNSPPHRIRRRIRKVLLGSVLLGGLAVGSMPAWAQTSSNCLVRQAADAAVQRQIALIDAAKRQVCQILDEQLRDTIRSINQQMGSFQNSVSGDLFRQLNGSISPINLPNITGLGSYNHVQNTAFGSALTTSTAPQGASSVATQPSASAPVSAPPPSGSSYGGMYQ